MTKSNRPIQARAQAAAAEQPKARKLVGAKPGKTVGPIPKDRATTPVPAPKRTAPPATKPATVKITAPVNKEVDVETGEEIEEVDEFSAADAAADAGEASEAEFVEENETDETEAAQEEDLDAEAEAAVAEAEAEAEAEEEEELPPVPAARPQPRAAAPAPVSRPGSKPGAGPAQAPAASKPVAKPGAAATTKAVAPRATTTLAVEKPQRVAGGSNIKADLILPRVLLMQDISDLVKARKAFAGQIVRSPSGEVLGGIHNPGEEASAVNVIPLAMQETWTIMGNDGKTWLGTEPRTPENDSLPWEFTNDEGEDCKRLKTIDLVCLLEKDLLAADGELELDEDGAPVNLDQAVLLPVGMTFKSTSFKAGKGIATFFAKIRAAQEKAPNTRPFHFMLPIGCEEESNDIGSFFVFNVGSTLSTPKSLRELSKGWYEQIQKSNVALVDENVAAEEAGNNMKPRKGKVSSGSQY